MKVAFLHDTPEYIGGAELTMAEFAASAPEEVELVDLELADTIVLGNVVSFGPDLMLDLRGKSVYWYHNDLSVWINPELKVRLDQKATHIFCSPLQRDRYGLDGHLVPPALDFDRFTSNGGEGTVSIGAWQNPGKGQQLLKEYSDEHGPIDVFGGGLFVPHGSNLRVQGAVDYAQVPEVLQRYGTFVFLPTVLEPFGRCVVEAWASGLELVLNQNVGARYWMEQEPEKLESAGQDFWEVVTNGS